MTVITTAGWVERHRHIVASLRTRATVPAETIVAELRKGWDLVVSGPTSPVGLLGIPRVPHLAILGDVPAAAMPGRPIFAVNMTVQEIEAGLYRQCRIRPEALADGTSIAKDPYTILDDDAYDPGRAWVFRALTGHAPRDVALFLADQLQRRPNIGKRLLAKDFVTALAEAPDLYDATWPDRVQAGWHENGGKNYLPPMLVLALHAELARWSLNDLGMIALSFDADGTAITTQTLIADIMATAAAIDRTTVMPHPTPIDALVGMVPFQTYTLLPPTAVFASRDASAGRAWSQACASLIPSVIGDHGPTLIDDMMTFAGHLTPTALQANIRAHPKAWPELRKGYGYSPQKRPAVEYWGLDRRQNAAVGLLEIARDAQAWNRAYPAADGDLHEDVTEQLLANAMQTVLCLWLEDAHALAAIQLDREIREGFRDRATREPTVFADETLDDVCRRPGFGSGLLRTARALIAGRAKPGKEGYSARAKALFWIAAIGDDLGWYLDLQRRAVAERCYREDRTDRSPHRRHNDRFSRYRNQRPAPTPLGMTSDPEAAACARDIAMMIASNGLDPMRSYIARPARNVAVESM